MLHWHFLFVTAMRDRQRRAALDSKWLEHYHVWHTFTCQHCMWSSHGNVTPPCLILISLSKSCSSSPADDYHLSSIPPAATRRHDSTFDAWKLCAWIIEHEELDWKHAFTGLNLGFAGSACVYLRVKLYNLPVWAYRLIQQCKGEPQNSLRVAPEVQQYIGIQ